MSKGTVAIGFIHNGMVHTPFMQSVVVCMSTHQNIIRNLLTGQSAYIPDARNAVVEQFLKGSDDWLWFLDYDMVFNPDAIDLLLEAADPVERPIVGGLYFVYLEGGVAPVFFINDDGAIKPLSNFSTGKLYPLLSTGMGCTLIHRSVLEKMEKLNDTEWKWFGHDLLGHKVLGEDLTFFSRAAKIGVQPYGHTGVHLDHIKTKLLTISDFAERSGVEVTKKVGKTKEKNSNEKA